MDRIQSIRFVTRDSYQRTPSENEAGDKVSLRSHPSESLSRLIRIFGTFLSLEFSANKRTVSVNYQRDFSRDNDKSTITPL